MRKFFIVGCPRSGTTLLQQILARHPEIVVPPETAFFTKLTSRWPRHSRRQRARIEADLEVSLAGARRPRTPTEAAALFERIASEYSTAIGRPSATWFGDKTPDHLRHVDTILATFPEARFVSIYRDGRDVALSLSKVPWAPSDVLVSFGIWLSAARLQLELGQRSGTQVLQVRYEDLVSSPEAEVRRILGHLELDYREDLLNGTAEPHGVPAWEREWKDRAHRPLAGDRVGVWRAEIDPAQAARMERWGGFELAELGYEVLERARSGSAPASTRLRWTLWRLRAAIALLFDRA